MRLLNISLNSYIQVMQPDRRNDAVDGSSLPVEMSLGGTIKPSTDEFYRATQDPKDVRSFLSLT